MPIPDTTQGTLPAPPRDAELLARIAERDESALGVLYDRFAPTLLAICARILGSAGDADDVVQEVFLQVWRQASRYDPARSSVSGWLSLIARSRAIDRLRNRRVADRVAAESHVEDPRTDASPEGLRNVFFAERRARISGALQALPAEQREVIELAFFRGLTQNEIAERTGTPLGTVKTRTLLAMKKLRKALEPDLGELL
ncbi:MAG TPA: sigma-70 family RNA polymerase sigma factor [Thermoanaerobaculia bacterium]|nr:sigma-70 family RNA polymerase sigma factor [Thermoanaerobaculia bacterium]